MNLECLKIRKNDIIVYIIFHFSIHSAIDRSISGNGANAYISYNVAILGIGWCQGKRINPAKGIKHAAYRVLHRRR